MTLLRIEGVAVGASLTRVASPSASGDNTLSSSSVSGDNLENKSPVALGDTTPKGSPIVSGESPEKDSAIVSGDTTLKGKTAAQDKSLLKADIYKQPYFLAIDDFEGDSPGPSSRKLFYEDVLSQGGLNEGIPLQRLSLPILPASIYKRITAEDFYSDPDTSTVDEMKWKKGKRKAKKGSDATVAGPSGTSITQDEAPAAAIPQAQVSTTAAASQVQDPATASPSQVQDPVPFTTITPAQASANAAANNVGVALATANVLAAVAASLASSSISSQANPTADSGDSGIPEPSMPEFCFPGYGDIPNITGEAQVWYTGVRHMLLWGVNDMNFADGKYKDVITHSYPLRDSLNKIMWDPCLTRPESSTLVKLGRIYARAQGDSRSIPGTLINRAYIRTVGLDSLSATLAAIFQAEAARRKPHKRPIRHTPETMKLVYATIARLEGEEAQRQAEEEARKKAEEEEKIAKAEAKKSKGRGKGKGKEKAT